MPYPHLTFDRKAGQVVGNINGDRYTGSFAGNALRVLFSKVTAIPADVDPTNVIARGQNYDYNETYQILPVYEWDTFFIQEIILGMQEMGNFSVQAMFTLRLNDSLPSVKTLPYEKEMQILQSIGQDSPGAGMVLNAWYGGRFTNRSSAQNPQGLVIDNIRGVYRYRLPGKEWKLRNPSDAYPYPVDVKEVSLDVSAGGTP